MKGYIHSFETCGAVDGPGIRCVVFTQGCPLRCKYCHNPDTWKPGIGQEIDSDALVKKIQRYEAFMRHTGGGLTISGGEPLMQAEFVADVFEKAKALGIHTTLDTSGVASASKVEQVLEHTDLILLDVKSSFPDMYKALTGMHIDYFHKMLELASKHEVKIWLRLVVVPGFTDTIEEIDSMRDLMKSYPNIEKAELLPFHKMGEYKWSQLGLQYELESVDEPPAETIKRLSDRLYEPL